MVLKNFTLKRDHIDIAKMHEKSQNKLIFLKLFNIRQQKLFRHEINIKILNNI